MRASRWAGAAGLTAAALTLTACGGGSSSGPGRAALKASAESTGAGRGAAPEASSGGLSSPPPGAVYFSIQRASLGHGVTGFVLVDGIGYVVYTYSGDSPDQPGTCTGSCAKDWVPVTGTAQKSPADKLPGTLGKIGDQVTYNGWPLYTRKGTPPNREVSDRQFKDIPMSASDILK